MRVDYFTKWVEVVPLASIIKKQIKGFVWKNIITHFKILRALVTDNKTQFNNAKFKKLCQSYGIEV